MIEDLKVFYAQVAAANAFINHEDFEVLEERLKRLAKVSERSFEEAAQQFIEDMQDNIDDYLANEGSNEKATADNNYLNSFVKYLAQKESESF